MFSPLVSGTTCLIESNISCHEGSPSLSVTTVSNLLQGMVVLKTFHNLDAVV
jgi:hypothetical protein